MHLPKHPQPHTLIFASLFISYHIKSPHFRFKWCFLCSGGLNMMILSQIIQKKTKTTTKQPKTSTHCFWFLWTGQGTFLVEDFHRPNGAKILRFGNFPETLTYLGSLENCQKSKSSCKIWLWKSRNFGYFLDRTRKQPHFQYIGHFLTMMGVRCGRKNGQTSIWYRSRQCVVSLVRLRSLLAS